MRCTSCLQGTPWECRLKGECNERSNSDPSDDLSSSVGNPIGSFLHAAGDGPDNAEGDFEDDDSSQDPDPDSFTTYKDDASLRDQQSTGRKRAAKLYPLNTEAECDWKMRKNCGGGDVPIVGCLNGKQEARHHGPDKNTLNNEKGNVHRICHSCHNRWHTLNDDDYVWGSVYPLHEPFGASIADIGLNEVFWDGRATVKVKD